MFGHLILVVVATIAGYIMYVGMENSRKHEFFKAHELSKEERADLEKEELSVKLKEKLPEFMIPGKTVKLENFPINKNGKIDRVALQKK